MVNEIRTKHNLDFLALPWENHPGYVKFKVGTVHGMYLMGEFSYDILAVINESPGNGHLDDVFEWFENSCRLDKKLLKVLEVWNKGFRAHLMEKRGFLEIPGTDDLIKIV